MVDMSLVTATAHRMSTRNTMKRTASLHSRRVTLGRGGQGYQVVGMGGVGWGGAVPAADWALTAVALDHLRPHCSSPALTHLPTQMFSYM